MTQTQEKQYLNYLKRIAAATERLATAYEITNKTREKTPRVDESASIHEYLDNEAF